jgi:hypothetical protein
MTTVLEECASEEQHSVVHLFCGRKDSVQRTLIKKCFLFAVESICGVNRFHLGGKCFADEEVETDVWMWLTQQSKDLHAAGFNALVKRWAKCINVCGGYVKK